MLAQPFFDQPVRPKCRVECHAVHDKTAVSQIGPYGFVGHKNRAKQIHPRGWNCQALA